jgi:hypothetical protein
LRWTAPELHDLFLEAAETERWLPSDKQRSRTSWWPAMQAEWLAYADPTTTVRLTPSAKQLDRYYLAIALSARLNNEDRRLIWAVAFSAVQRARGPQWKRIGKLMGIDRRTVNTRYLNAIVSLSLMLRADGTQSHS